MAAVGLGVIAGAGAACGTSSSDSPAQGDSGAADGTVGDGAGETPGDAHTGSDGGAGDSAATTACAFILSGAVSATLPCEQRIIPIDVRSDALNISGPVLPFSTGTGALIICNVPLPIVPASFELTHTGGDGGCGVIAKIIVDGGVQRTYDTNALPDGSVVGIADLTITAVEPSGDGGSPIVHGTARSHLLQSYPSADGSVIDLTATF
jgi:hypothetical protein